MAVLMTLVFQNSAEAIFMRCSFKPREDVAEEDGAETPQPASSTAVVMAEVVKLVCSFLLQRMASPLTTRRVTPARTRL